MGAGTEFGRDTIEINKKWWRTDLKFGSFKWNGAFYPKRRRFINKKKKRKTRTVSFWTTLFIFLLPPFEPQPKTQTIFNKTVPPLSPRPHHHRTRQWPTSRCVIEGALAKGIPAPFFFYKWREPEEREGGELEKEGRREREERRNNTEVVEKRKSQPSVSNHQQNHHQHHCQLLYPSSSSQVTLPLFIFLHAERALCTFCKQEIN